MVPRLLYKIFPNVLDSCRKNGFNGKRSHEACLRFLRSCQVFFLVVDPREAVIFRQRFKKPCSDDCRIRLTYEYIPDSLPEEEKTRRFLQKNKEREDMQARTQRDFDPLRIKAKELRTEMLSRLELERDDPRIASSTVIASVESTLNFGVMAGPRPLGDVAEYLELLANRLPPSTADR